MSYERGKQLTRSEVLAKNSDQIFNRMIQNQQYQIPQFESRLDSMNTKSMDKKNTTENVNGFLVDTNINAEIGKNIPMSIDFFSDIKCDKKRIIKEYTFADYLRDKEKLVLENEKKKIENGKERK